MTECQPVTDVTGCVVYSTTEDKCSECNNDKVLTLENTCAESCGAGSYASEGKCVPIPQQDILDLIAANIGFCCTAPNISECTPDDWCEVSGCGRYYSIVINSEGNVVYLFGTQFRMIDLQHGK